MAKNPETRRIESKIETSDLDTVILKKLKHTKTPHLEYTTELFIKWWIKKKLDLSKKTCYAECEIRTLKGK